MSITRHVYAWSDKLIVAKSLTEAVQIMRDNCDRSIRTLRREVRQLKENEEVELVGQDRKGNWTRQIKMLPRDFANQLRSEIIPEAD